MPARIAPSILAADFARLAEQLAEAEAAGAEVIHIDVMDGQFVPNITIGPLLVEACRRSTDLPLDVHLMIVHPERFVRDFAAAGADSISVHAEASPHLHRALQEVRDAGARAGLAVNPLTPLEVYVDALPDLDLALLMTVNPGFGGQRFIEGSIDRLRRLRALRDRIAPACEIAVDGGINPATAGRVVEAGAQLLVAGSAIFGAGATVAQSMKALRSAAEASPP